MGPHEVRDNPPFSNGGSHCKANDVLYINGPWKQDILMAPAYSLLASPFCLYHKWYTDCSALTVLEKSNTTLFLLGHKYSRNSAIFKSNNGFVLFYNKKLKTITSRWIQWTFWFYISENAKKWTWEYNNVTHDCIEWVWYFKQDSGSIQGPIIRPK